MNEKIDNQAQYRTLQDRYQELLEVLEVDAQKIHDLKRKLETSNAENAYLLQEVETLTNSSNSNSVTHSKEKVDLEEMRQKYNLLRTELDSLQCEYDSVSSENADLREQLRVASVETNTPQILSEKEDTSKKEYIQRIELENLDLLQKLDLLSEQNMHTTRENVTLQNVVDGLQDQVNCLEENLRSKRAELDENAQLLESTQEQLTDVRLQLAMLTATPESDDQKKGNSLFAEVDDQRQAMKDLLASQKKSYVEMKKIFNESEHEIRRLKKENTTVRAELQACISIFRNSDKTYQDKLNERIRQLMAQNEELETKLRLTDKRIQALAEQKEVIWLDSVFTFCKQETNDLKQQLHSARIQKGSLEEQLRNAQQDTARWRFEVLKTRHILSDRENLLKEHHIVYEQDIVSNGYAGSSQCDGGTTIGSLSSAVNTDDQLEITLIAPVRSGATGEKLRDSSPTAPAGSIVSLDVDEAPINLSAQADNKTDENTTGSNYSSPTPDFIANTLEGQDAKPQLLTILRKDVDFLEKVCDNPKQVRFCEADRAPLSPLISNNDNKPIALKLRNSDDQPEKKSAPMKQITTKSGFVVRRLCLNSKRKPN